MLDLLVVQSLGHEPGHGLGVQDLDGVGLVVVDQLAALVPVLPPAAVHQDSSVTQQSGRVRIPIVSLE